MTSPGISTRQAARWGELTQPAVTAALPAQRGTVDLPQAAFGTSAPPAGRVLLIDPDSTAAQSLAHALTAIGIATVTTAPSFDPDTDAAAGDGSPATDGASAAELAVVSMRLGAATSETISALRAAGWNRVIALSAAAGIDEITGALKAGATGAVITGHAAPAHNVPTGIYDLSPREVEVLRMVADGRSNKWIGERLDLSALTVKSHLARIGRKLGTGDRAHMVALALRAGVIN